MKISFPQTKLNQIAKEARKVLRMKEVSCSEELGTLDCENDTIHSSCDSSTPVLQGSTETLLQDSEADSEPVQLQQYRYFGSGGNSGPSTVDFLPLRSQWEDANVPEGEHTVGIRCIQQGLWSICQGEKAGGPWKQAEVKSHINVLKLKEAFLALKSFLKNQRNLQVSCEWATVQQ